MEVPPADVEVADEGDRAGGVGPARLPGPGGDGRRRQQVVVVLLRERRARAPAALDGRPAVRLLRAAATASGSRRGRAGRGRDAHGAAVDAGGARDDVVGAGRDGAVRAGGAGETGRGRRRGRVAALLHAAV